MRATTLLICLLFVPATSQSQQPVLFRGVRVFDGAAVMQNTDVLVESGKIARLGRALAVPTNAQVIDGKGKTLLPGFIDAHTHTFGTALQDAVIFGVTTTLDMFTDPTLARQMRAEQKEGRANARADLFSAGVLVTAPGGHGTEYGMPIPTITSPDSAQAFVDARIAEGSDFIKLVYDDGGLFQIKWNTLSYATMRAVIDAAHKRGRLAVVHVSTAKAAEDAISAGADGLVHLFTDAAGTSAFATSMQKRKAFAIPTLVVLKSITGVGGSAELLNDERITRYLPAPARASLAQGFPVRPGAPHKSFDYALQTVKQLAQAGVAILAGTDAPNPGTAHGAAIHAELALLVQAGLTPSDALAAATSTPARIFSLNDRGRIKSGMRADLVLVDGDPTTDIRATRAIAGVWKGGQAIDRDKYAQAIAAQNSSAAPSGLANGDISSFEDNTPSAKFGSPWAATTDRMAGGTSDVTFKVVDGGANNTGKSLQVNGSINAGFAFPWAGVMWTPAAQPMQPADLSSKQGVRFWAKGDGGTYRLMLFAASLGQRPVEQPFVAGAEWKEYMIPWQAFGLDGKGIMAVIFTAGGKPGAFQFQIDEVGVR
jgi:imidazolonepropionase-like amidohydrolase